MARISKHGILLLLTFQVCDFGLSRLKHNTFLSSKSTAGTVRIPDLRLAIISKSQTHNSASYSCMLFAHLFLMKCSVLLSFLSLSGWPQKFSETSLQMRSELNSSLEQ